LSTTGFSDPLATLRNQTSSLWNPDDTAESQSYSDFRKKYVDKPGDFVLDCIRWKEGEGPSVYQLEILDSILPKRRVAARGPHGLGKTALAAWAILWFALVHDQDTPWKIPTTASAWRQLEFFLWPEIKRWTRELNWELIGRPPFKPGEELLNLKLRTDYGESFAMASDDEQKLEGAHAPKVLVVFDESKAIPDKTWDAVEGIFSTGDCYWLSISTPGEPIGRFYQIHQRAKGYSDWTPRHVTLEEALDADRIDAKWALDRELQWGTDSAVFKNRVLGEFAESDSDSIIPLSWIEEANDRWHKFMEEFGDANLTIDQIGVDVARQGGDQTVLAHRHGDVIVKLERYSKIDTMQTVTKVRPTLDKYPMCHANIDVIGIGAGVYDRLNEFDNYKHRLGYFNASERTEKQDRSGTWSFIDKRSAAYWTLREILDPAYDSQIALPPDDDLTGDLTAIKWRAMSNGRIQVEKKEDIRKELGRSTDSSDAVAYAFWAEVVGGGIEFF
jgi:hypothetical protein